MPSFDIVSEVDMHELGNALDQARREIGNRFDFKGVSASFDLQGEELLLGAEVEFQTRQMHDVLMGKMAKRGLEAASLKVGEVVESGSRAVLHLRVQQGIEGDIARRIVKLVKDRKLKVQVAIQGAKLRVSGKKRDDLQAVIGLLKEQDYGLPLQFNNFRD